MIWVPCYFVHYGKVCRQGKMITWRAHTPLRIPHGISTPCCVVFGKTEIALYRGYLCRTFFFDTVRSTAIVISIVLAFVFM